MTIYRVSVASFCVRLAFCTLLLFWTTSIC